MAKPTVRPVDRPETPEEATRNDPKKRPHYTHKDFHGRRPQMAGSSLDLEIAFYNTHLDELRADAEAQGKSAVLIHNRRIVGYFDSVVAAGQEGYSRFGTGRFLARAVPAVRRPIMASIFSH